MLIFNRVKLRDPVEAGDDGFFRIAFGARPGTLLVLSRRSLDVIDLEVSPMRQH